MNTIALLLLGQIGCYNGTVGGGFYGYDMTNCHPSRSSYQRSAYQHQRYLDRREVYRQKNYEKQFERMQKQCQPPLKNEQ